VEPGTLIGRYRIVRPLGRGGMGVVYVARDERLGRDVALKMIAGLPDDTARSRFWREARAAASVNHPHICQVFEVDETAEGIFLTMELLEGEPLDRVLARRALAPQDAVPIALGVLGALGALHARDLVHRDVKPSNVFLTSHGPKLLDFGLARPTVVTAPDAATTAVTEAGMMVGTPHYMAPEQVTGGALDGRTDLYAAGAVLFQMLAGRPPFVGTGPDLLFAALKESPPALQGPPAVVAIDRVIRRAMRKTPGDRYATAALMAADLAAVSLSGATGAAVVPVRALTRIVVPPLRMARTDPDVGFLSFGLAEAVSGTLAGLGDVVVRAPAVAAKWSEEPGDPRRLAAEADVDLVLACTLLRSGPQLRVTTQLLEASSGTVIGSTSIKGVMDDIFALEDALTTAAMELLAPRLGHTAQRVAAAPPRRDVPASPRAFELFLRGMEQARRLTDTEAARALFQQAVDEDPQFAPAWAALGRAHRVMGKFYGDRAAHDELAEAAFRRALALSPDLPLAHRYLTHFEAEHGRAGDAIVRLLGHAATNRHDAQLFAGLVHACRYAGLLDQSIAAHDEALRLDPNVTTSVEYTIALLPDGVEKAARLAARRGAVEAVFPAIALGNPPDAREWLATVSIESVPPAFQRSYEAIEAFAHGRAGEVAAAIERAIAAHVDPEALFIFGVLLVRVNQPERGLEVLSGAVGAGYAPATTLVHNPGLDVLRGHAAFNALCEDAWQRLRAARERFDAAGGPEMLGLPAATAKLGSGREN
jgi:eukaryotic-like serine/threonine-protein kinase